MKKKKIVLLIISILILILIMFKFEALGEIASNKVIGTYWALIPSVIAILLALITKEVYISLLLGIVVGALFYNGFMVQEALATVISEGFIKSLADEWNAGILMFLIMLGILVAVINKSGATRAYGEAVAQRVKSRKGIMAATFGLGSFIFIDDYFNCLTVGNVMRPLTDKFKISREKLAYIIDSTAAPICMIAPISSWAAVVSGLVEGYNGIELFIKTIPYNFYSILTLVMIIYIITTGNDYGLMKRYELNSLKEDNNSTEDYNKIDSKGKVYDLVLPILVLIISCVICMLYTGGFFEGSNLIDGFANCNASIALPMGAAIALIFTFIFYIFRKVLLLNEFMECVPQGFKDMVPAILILVFAWSLGNMTGLLGTKEYVASLMEVYAVSFANFLPAIIFLVALGLAFSTGSSWGTFSILIPIVVAVFAQDSEMVIISTSACLGGAVCGDHCSPISDTTIMSSSGAGCNHINHVSSQLPYALTVAGVSFVSLIMVGFVQNAWIVLPIAILLMILTLIVIRMITKYLSSVSN
ncbi:MAG: Na+/H+ antiporter NhaC family protein [Clostridium sp.]|nr:Na+/H+ antiporter NhaC family protein [Clostridium sp.]